MVQQQSQQQQQQQQQASSMMINQSQVLSKPANQLQSASQALVANLASQLQSQVLPLMAQTIANTNNSGVYKCKFMSRVCINFQNRCAQI